MFGLTESIENALGIVGTIFEGEAPTKRHVAKLIADGITIAAIASMFGVAEDVIEGLIE